MSTLSKEQEIDRILSRGIIKEIIPSIEEFRTRLLKSNPMKFYIGADPTSTALHLSHAKNYMLLEEFRKLGHKVIVLIGDFTARIGDPTEKNTARKQLSAEEVKTNVASWEKQIRPLMDFDTQENPPKIVFNSEWLARLNFRDIVDLASNFSVQRMLERDMFERRIATHQPIFLHEFMYPLMQGFDSVAMDVDVELCGTDQIFNALIGRTLLKRMKNKDKFIVAVNLMENPVTKELMSKSRGVGVFLDSTPFDMFGSIMAQPDEMIEVLLINNTRLALTDIETLKKLKNPRDAKMIAAFEITKIFHGNAQATNARERFITQIQKKETPENISTICLGSKSLDLLSIVRKCMPDASNSENRRLILQGAIQLNGKREKNPTTIIPIIPKGIIIRIGKTKIFKIMFLDSVSKTN